MEALLLTIYFIVVLYVLYKMALSLEARQEKRVEIRLDTDFLIEQTQSQLSCQPDAKHVKASPEEISFKKSKLTFPALGLVIGATKADKAMLNSPEVLELKQQTGMSDEAILGMLQRKITVRVSPTGKQPLREVPYLSVLVNNGTEDMQLYINWDNSSIEMMGQGNRVIRSTPNMPRDLSQQQIYSVVNPGQSVSSEITVEKNFYFDPETGRMELGSPLVNLKDRVEFAEATDPTTKEKNIQNLYNLDLMVGLKRVTDPPDKLINLLVPFGFQLEIKVSQIALPPLRWLMRHIGNNNRRREGSWFWGRSKSFPR